MIMNKSQSTSAPLQSNSSMSSFMSGLLKERATQCALPNAKWSIHIVDDNARPKHIDKRKLKLLQQGKTQSNKDLRWCSSSPNTIKGSLSDTSITERSKKSRPRRAGTTRHSTPSTNKNGCNRFDSSTSSKSRSGLPAASGLRRAAASDTMLLKMPVRSKSPGGISAKPALGGVSQANANWKKTGQQPQQQMQSTKNDLMAGLSKLPKFDLGLEDGTVTTTPVESDWSSYRSTGSDASSLSTSSRTSKSMSSLLGMSNRSSSSSQLFKKTKSDKKKKSKKTKKSNNKQCLSPNSSSDSLRARASLLGLDLR